MKGSPHMGREQLERELLASREEIADLRSKLEKALAEIDQLKRAQTYSDRLMTYYTNPDTPPSAESLEWKEQKRQRAKKTEGREKPRRGARNGHAGVSRRRNPGKTVRCGFGRSRSGRKTVLHLPRCGCGGCMAPGGPRVRDITDIEITCSETRYRIETAVCTSCGRTGEAPSGLPRAGNFGGGLVKLVAQLRAGRMPLREISGALRSLTGVSLSVSTINNVMARVGEACGPAAEDVARRVEESYSAGFDETSWRDDGQKVYANVAQSGSDIAINISASRATLMLDSMDKFCGVAVTDGYAAYGRFDRDGRRQSCWAHDLRQTRHLAEKRGSVPPEVRRVRQQLRDDCLWVFNTAKMLALHGAHSPRLRYAMNCALQDVICRYRGTDDADMQKVLDKLERHLHCMFAFLEFPGVEPTNNASERALRYVVVLRKIIGQTKGGTSAMKRLADFLTCVLTWRANGSSVAEEVSRLI